MSTDSVTSAVTIVDPARTRIAGAIKQAAGATGASFEYLLTTAKMESELQPDRGGVDLVGEGAVPVHRPDLARHRQGSRQPARLRPYADAISKSLVRQLLGAAIRRAPGDHGSAQRSGGQSSAMAGALTQSNSFKLTGEIGRRPVRRRTLHGAFHGRRRRRQADHRRAGQSERRSAPRCFPPPPPPTSRSSTTAPATPAASRRSTTI